jgi:hypothetical protein
LTITADAARLAKMGSFGIACPVGRGPESLLSSRAGSARDPRCLPYRWGLRRSRLEEAWKLRADQAISSREELFGSRAR